MTKKLEPDKQLDYGSFEGKFVYFRHQEKDHIGRLKKVVGNRIIVSGLADGMVTETCVEPAIIDNVIFDISQVTRMNISSEKERDNALKLKFPYNKLIGEYICIVSSGNPSYGRLNGITVRDFELKPSLVLVPLGCGSVLKLEERLPVFVRQESVKNIVPSSEEDVKALIERSKEEYKLQEKEAKIRELELEKKLKELND